MIETGQNTHGEMQYLMNRLVLAGLAITALVVVSVSLLGT
jgi:hypothetical protein